MLKFNFSALALGLSLYAFSGIQVKAVADCEKADEACYALCMETFKPLDKKECANFCTKVKMSCTGEAEQQGMDAFPRS